MRSAVISQRTPVSLLPLCNVEIMDKHNVIFAIQQPVAPPLQQQVTVIASLVSTIGMTSCTASRTYTDLQTILAVCMRIVAVQHVNISNLCNKKAVTLHLTECWNK